MVLLGITFLMYDTISDRSKQRRAKINQVKKEGEIHQKIKSKEKQKHRVKSK